MFPNLQDSFRVVAPHLAVELVREDYRTVLDALCLALPYSSTAILECRLANASPQVDLSVVLSAGDGSRQVWAGMERWLDLPAEQPAWAGWTRIGEFCAAWADSHTPLHDGVPDVNLEFDLEPSRTRIAVPSLFFSLGREQARRLGNGPPPEWIDGEALRILRGGPLPQETRQALLRCLGALPTDAGVCYLGVMLSRPSAPLRLNVFGLPSQGFAEYVERLGWTGAATALQAVVSEVGGWSDYLVLTLDVEGGGRSRIGLECFLDRQPTLNPRWPPFLDYLVATGSCTEAKRDCLLAWPGSSSQADHPGVWPRNLGLASELLGLSWQSFILRRLSHVKLVFQENQLREAKVYLWFGDCWESRGGQPLGPSSRSQGLTP